MSTNLPFLWGAQYYRAPTPEPQCWEYDLKRMADMGFNAVKYWVQWRWGHRAPNRYYWDDLDRLMDLAAQNKLAVTLNLILDVAPVWLYEKHPDAKQMYASGLSVQPYANACRQVGGTPGPCYNHPGALADRQQFVSAAIDHFKGHPAMSMWDVWNEPEQAFPARHPNATTLVCYCPSCRAKFIPWLKTKYESIERLNDVWGRCYETWEQVEMPRARETFTDFIDWREFNLDTMTGEAAWRLDMVARQDPAHVRYLHVVPNTGSPFCSVTCVDDFDLAQHCQVWAATMAGGPTWTTQVISAGRGKICYNVESHINNGSARMHQRMIERDDLLRDLLPQVGLGIKGFLFWQYRPETLGNESPAWGMVKLDGTDRQFTGLAREFWNTLRPHVDGLLESFPSRPQIGIWKSRKNEIFHYSMYGELRNWMEGNEGYIQALYGNSFSFRMISGQMLERGDLEDLKLLIMPSCYYLTEGEAQHLDAWVRRGGVVLNEAHLGGYNGDTGRHCRSVPGCGLAQAWGIREVVSTSSYHLKLAAREEFAGDASDDLKKALKESGTAGGQYFPIKLRGGAVAWGADRYAIIEGEDITVEGSADGTAPCIVSKQVGRGTVIYCGSNLGQGSQKGAEGLVALIRLAAERAGVAPTLGVALDEPGSVHVDLLEGPSGPRYILFRNRTDREQRLRVTGPGGKWRGLFSGQEWSMERGDPLVIRPGLIDLLCRKAK